MSSAPFSRRRWFQFSLTSVFTLTTIIAVWLAWELAFIRERQAWLRENAALVDDSVRAGPRPDARIPRWRVWLGDTPVATIVLPDRATSDDRAQITSLFAEAKLFRSVSGQKGSLGYTYFIPDDSPHAAEPAKTPALLQYGPAEPPSR